MKQSTRLIIFFPIIIVLSGLSWFLIQNKSNNADHGKERLIEEYDIHCDDGNHIESFYHDPSGRDMVPMEEFYTLDIYCVDKNGIKNGVYYKFGGDTPIEKGYFLNGKMDGERNLYLYDEVVNYKNGVRDQESGYYSDGVLRYTGGYIDEENGRQETFYYKNGNISTIRIYSGNDLIERREFYENGNIKYECIEGGACISYDENGKITRKTPFNYRNYTGEEFRTYPNGSPERYIHYTDSKYDGLYTKYYENGQISYECNYISGDEERCITYDENGNIEKETRYYKGNACSKEVYDEWMGLDGGDGPFTGYYENGLISFSCNYMSGQEEGRCVHYKRNGEIKDEHRYHEGNIINQYMYESMLKQEQDKSARKEIVDVNTNKGTLTYNTKANITYTDTEGKEFTGIGTITYSDQEGNSITMLDRNLGATKSGTGEESYGYYFGWGNNYGFINGGDISNKGRGNGYSWNNPYVSKDTNLQGSNNNSYRNLWGGANDNERNLWNPKVNNGYMRQGPCPAGYHIPSVGERTKLINIWFKHEHGIDIEYIDGMFYQYYGNLVDEFTRDFKLPYAGSRAGDVGKEGQYRGSSLGEKPNNFAYELRLYPKKEIDLKTGETPHTIVLGGSSLGWWAKLSVRCFKDEYENPSSVITLKYETNGGTKIQSQSLPKGSAGFLPGYTTRKTGFELEGWYLDNNFTKKYDFSAKLDKDTTIYAKWEKSENKKHNNLTGNRLTDEEIKDYYYYNCTCPKGYSYVPEVPTYGEPGCEIEVCENGNNCRLYSTSVNSTCNKKLDINKVSSRVPMDRKTVELNYWGYCSCPTGFDFVAKTADTYADSCDRKYCVDPDCKKIETWHIWVKDLCEK